MRYLAVDYGTKRIGLAICDELEIIASPLAQIKSASGNLVRREGVREGRSRGGRRKTPGGVAPSHVEDVLRRQRRNRPSQPAVADRGFRTHSKSL